MKILLILALLLFGSVSVLACGIPDINHSFAVCAHGGTEPVTILNFPDGSGSSFLEARDQNGVLLNATITLVVLDGSSVPVVNFPFEDMWLQSEDGGMVPCVGGTIADANTDMNGMTQWVYPLRAGGASQAPCQVLINGDAIVNPPGLPVAFNSPDIDGDGLVNLGDVALFSHDFFGGYDFRSDFHRDGVINLSDVSRLAQSFGVSCP